jgi:acid phosphatase type 7
MKKTWISILLVAVTMTMVGSAEKVQGADPYTVLKDFTVTVPVPVQEWKYHRNDTTGAWQANFDDAAWPSVDFNFNWGENPTCWFRKQVTIPPEMAGKAVWMNIIVDDKGIIYVDGLLRHHFDWYGKAFLTAKARAGETFLICVKGLNRKGSGHLVSTELLAIFDPVRYEIDEKMETLKPLTHIQHVQIDQWRYRFGDNEKAIDPNLDDSKWELWDVGDRWQVENTVSWLRKRIVLPEKINGFAIAGSNVAFSVSIDDAAEIYLNGKGQQAPGAKSSAMLLTQNARAGDSFFLAVKAINKDRSGVLLDAHLTFSTLQPLAEQANAYLKEITGLTMLLERIPNPDPQWGKSIISSLTDALQWPSAKNVQDCQQLLTHAEGMLAPVKKAAADYPIQIKGPYLQNVRQDAITIMWETDTASDTRVEYGTTNRLGLSFYRPEKVTIHEVTLGHLKPETPYQYRVASGKLASTTNTFHTAIQRDTPFRFVVWGDNHTNAPQFEKNINRMIPYKPDLAISVGDMVLTGSNYDLWGQEFFIPGRNLFKNTPLYTTLGNHEYGGYNVGTPVEWFEKFFSLPGKEYYYSYNYGNSHFIHLNPHTNSPFGVLPGSEQYNWLLADLESDASKNAEWRFVFFHEPPIGEPLMAEHIVPLLEKYKVTMEFSGHFHTYMRDQRPVPNGPIYVITGGGGGSLSDDSRMSENPNAHFQVYKSIHHFCLIDIKGNTLTFKAIAINGNLIDSMVIKK